MDALNEKLLHQMDTMVSSLKAMVLTIPPDMLKDHLYLIDDFFRVLIKHCFPPSHNLNTIMMVFNNGQDVVNMAKFVDLPSLPSTIFEETGNADQAKNSEATRQSDEPAHSTDSAGNSILAFGKKHTKKGSDVSQHKHGIPPPTKHGPRSQTGQCCIDDSIIGSIIEKNTNITGTGPDIKNEPTHEDNHGGGTEEEREQSDSLELVSHHKELSSSVTQKKVTGKERQPHHMSLEEYRDYRCCICEGEVILPSKTNFQTHLEKKHIKWDGMNRLLYCKIGKCTKTWKIRGESALGALDMTIRHVTRIHGRPVPDYAWIGSCPICGIMVPSKHAFRCHQHSHKKADTHSHRLRPRPSKRKRKVWKLNPTDPSKTGKSKGKNVTPAAHYASLEEIKDYKCCLCDSKKIFSKKSEFESHLREIHAHQEDEKSWLACKIGDCKYLRSYRGESMLAALDFTISHVTKVHGRTAPDYIWSGCCSVCGVIIPSKESYRVHCRTHTRSQRQVQGNFSAKKQNVNQHGGYFDSSGKLYCQICHRKLRNAITLRHHIKRAHIGVVKDKKCQLCDYSTERQMDIEYHSWSKHKLNPSNLKVMQCEKCEFVGLEGRVMNIHHRVRHDIDYHLCPHCGKLFKTRWNLAQHIETHTGKKRFKCIKCFMAFVRKGHALKHIQSVHQSRVFSCDVRSCTYLCATETELQFHMKTTHAPITRSSKANTSPKSSSEARVVPSTPQSSNNIAPLLPDFSILEPVRDLPMQLQSAQRPRAALQQTTGKSCIVGTLSFA